MEAIWRDFKPLTAPQKEQLALILRTEIDSEVFQKVEHALIFCVSNHLQIDEQVFNKQSQAQLKRKLNSLDKALDRALAIVTDGLLGPNRELLDESCYLANDDDGKYLGPAKDGANSHVEERLREIKKGVSFHRDKMKKPDKSRYRFTNAIRDFEVQFSEIFPQKNRRPSKEPESLFARLIIFLLNELLGIDIQDADKHIRKALSEKYTGK